MGQPRRNPELHETARAIVADDKGILAADESSGTIKKRFDSISLESTEENRRAYRDMLFTTPELEQYVSGVILFDETIRQSTTAGTPFPKYLADKGIIPGIKVDTGAKELAGAPGEKVTEGLDGLRERLQEYRELGARFAKWRAVITIGPGIPSAYCIEVNAHALARYAALCQEQGLVPIVEPEVLMDADNDIEICYRATKRTLHKVFDELYHQRVDLEGMLLKPNMVISGKGSPTQASAQEVAEWTIRCFREAVPAAVPGIVFLSGGQSDQQASENLNAINSLGPQPWVLSFSYGRALQAPALAAWGGSAENVEAGQAQLALRARANSAAVAGRYSAEMEELARSG
ncbi:MAG TPA: class I fructose-bisphosphate aldolase [Gaiellaceae bacterium]|jgi:fructose-bisphosphate aldolase class I